MFAILILTLNEEGNLAELLPSIRPDIEIAVLDSGSNDMTIEIARAAGAAVYHRQFDSFAGQRNHAQQNISFRSKWVLHLDADERVTPELVEECERISVLDPRDIDGFYIAPKMLWEGHWLPRCTDFPAYQARFVRAPEFRFIEVGHGQREAPEMRMGYIKSHYLHEMSAGGDNAWLNKHRLYARREALQHQQIDIPHGSWKQLFSKDRLVRRRALKRASYRLPCRPFLRFCYQYLLRGGFLDGGPAFKYCTLLSKYEAFARNEIRRLEKK